MAFYQATIVDHLPMVSANKGTPGIEFTVTLTAKKTGAKWEPMDHRDRRLWLWFPPGGDHSWNMKKLKHAGFKGGTLSQMNLAGNQCEVISDWEKYEGKEREKFELALPGGQKSERSEDAFLAIDAILQSEPMPDDVSQAPPSQENFEQIPDDEVPF